MNCYPYRIRKHFTIYTKEEKTPNEQVHTTELEFERTFLKQETYSRKPNLIIRRLTLNHKEPCDPCDEKVPGGSDAYSRCKVMAFY